jgi:hypothetical protein
MVSGRRAAAGGVGIALAYVLLAALSGQLSPLARGPLLDGLGPPQAYRWVSPPPDLAATNLPPSSLTGVVPLRPSGVKGASFVSSDSQITLIVPEGGIAPHGADTSVKVVAEPVDPADLAPVGEGLAAFGNAYEIRATYLPSKTPVKALREAIDVVLSYPVTATLNASSHELLASIDGKAWTLLQSKDSPAAQQVEARTPDLGYAVVAGVPHAAPVTSSPSATAKTASPVAIWLFVAAGISLLLGLGLFLRGRRA